jgi:hypothetical protein
MKENELLLTLEMLQEILDYDPVSGIFIRKRNTPRWLSGQQAGSVSKIHGYRIIGINGKYYRACRLAWFYMTGEWPEKEIDHINAERADDRFVNLRGADRSMNAENLRHPHKDNSHGLIGVMHFKKNWTKKVKWTAQIMAKGTRHHLGVFDSPEAAHEAYLEAKHKFHKGCTI